VRLDHPVALQISEPHNLRGCTRYHGRNPRRICARRVISRSVEKDGQPSARPILATSARCLRTNLTYSITPADPALALLSTTLGLDSQVAE
jgi:hypothetical protein